MITTRLIFGLLAAIALLSATPCFSAGTDREGKKHLLRRFEEMRKRRAPRSGVLEANIRSVAIDQMRLAPSKFNVEAQADQPKWSQVGPRSTAGRIKSIVCDKKNPGTVYIGAAAGGVWKSTDEGNNWTPLMDQANAIAMGALCIAPDDPSTIYAGTGEQVIGANIYLGAGLMRSTDKGATWAVIGLADVGSFSRVLIHPSTPSTIMASCMNEKAGVWKSTDRGTTWKRILEGQIYDMSMNVVDANEWFVAVKDSGIMATTDGGATWRRRMSGLVGEVGRVSVQHAITNPNNLFALLELNSLAVIARSLDKGLTWTVVFRDNEGCFFSGTCVPEESQGFYDNVVSVSPHSSADIFVCGIDVWVSRDGGDTWRNATNGYADGDGNNYPHVDQHSVAWDPQKPGEVYVGNDGGMMKTWDTGQTWLPINNDLSVTQFYAFDVDRAARGRMFGGTQDNGTLGTNGSADWDTLSGGDGMTTLLDPSNANILYGSGPKGDLFKLTLNTSSSKRILAGVDLAEKCEWVAPVIIDPQQTTTLFTGRERVYRSDNAGESWRAVSPRLSNTVTAIAISPADQEVVWAGGSYGEVLLSTDYGENWKSVNQFDIPSLLYVSSIACARRDRNVAWATYSSYGTPQVIKTTNLGVTWRNAWISMPNVPVNAIVLHPDDDNIAFIGTDIGVFATYDGGYKWTPFGEGLPRSPVLDLRADATFSYLRAATHGRSIWEAPLIKKEPTEPMITAPLGGERFLALTRIGIGWSRFGNTTNETYNVEFTTNDGLSWVSVAQGVTWQHGAWTVPNTPTPSARIRVSSQSTPSAVVESRSFAIVRRERGVILDQYAQSWAPYGIAWDGSDGLWMTNIHSATILHVKRDYYVPVNALTIKGAGDSLFTDIAYDRDSALIYVHRLDDFDGTSTTVFVLDTFGTIKRSFPSQARRYGTGLELVNGDLIATERDGEQRIVKMDPVTGALRSSVPNPLRSTYGPRSIAADGLGNVVQVHTSFPPGGGKLNSVVAVELSLPSIDNVADQLILESRKGPINARGIEIDRRDQSMWVSDIDGVIWKIAGMNYVPPTTSVSEDVVEQENISIAPHPVTTYALITVAPIGRERSIIAEIYDVTGRLVLTMPRTFQSASDPTIFRFHAETLHEGAYVIRVSSDGDQGVRKVFIVTPTR